MESMENSPIVLVFAQLVVLLANAYLFARQKNQGENKKLDVAMLLNQVSEAIRTAEGAKQDVMTVEVTHYKKLAALHDAQQREIEHLRSKVDCLQETVDSLSNKLASRDRADKGAEKRAGKASKAEEEPPAGQMDLEDVIRAHGLPLVNPPAAGGPPVNHSFGKKAR